jgi:hypothetical protein
MGEDVVDLPGDPGALGEGGGMGLGLARPACLRERPLGFFCSEQIGVTRQAQFSLAGAQSKTALLRQNERWGEPQSRQLTFPLGQAASSLEPGRSPGPGGDQWTS